MIVLGTSQHDISLLRSRPGRRERSKVRRRFLTHRSKLSCNHLGLPVRIKRDARDCLALVTHELKNGQFSLGTLIASPEGFDQHVWSSLALRTLAHQFLLLGSREAIILCKSSLLRRHHFLGC